MGIRNALYEGITETGEPVQVLLSNVVLTLQHGRFFEVHTLPGLGIRLHPDESQRFREALRAWWGCAPPDEAA